MRTEHEFPQSVRVADGAVERWVIDHPLPKRRCDLVVLNRPKHPVNPAAQALIPPLRWMNWARGSESGLYADGSQSFFRDCAFRIYD
jgi:hypothetical protein